MHGPIHLHKTQINTPANLHETQIAPLPIVTQADEGAAQSLWESISDDCNSWSHLSDLERKDISKAFARHRIAHTAELVDALRALVPNINCDNPNVADTLNLPCVISMGELRQAWAALAKAGGQHERD